MGLDHRFAAMQAEALSVIRWNDFYSCALDFWRQSVSTAECLYCILRDAQRIKTRKTGEST